MASAPTLQIRLVGAFAVAVGDRVVPERTWGSRKARQVIALLALAPGHRLTLDQRCDARWPDLVPDAARRLRPTSLIPPRPPRAALGDVAYDAAATISATWTVAEAGSQALAALAPFRANERLSAVPTP